MTAACALRNRNVNDGLTTTWEVLRKTKNDVAFEILIRAFDESPRSEIREGALRTLLNRRSVAGPKTLLARWHELSDEWKEIVAENPGRMSAALRDAVLDTDHQTCANGCDTAVRICEYDLIPTLRKTMRIRCVIFHCRHWLTCPSVCMRSFPNPGTTHSGAILA